MSKGILFLAQITLVTQLLDSSQLAHWFITALQLVAPDPFTTDPVYFDAQTGEASKNFWNNWVVTVVLGLVTYISFIYSSLKNSLSKHIVILSNLSTNVHKSLNIWQYLLSVL